MTKRWGGRRVGTIRAIVRAVYTRTCHICGGEITPTQLWDVDHVIPRSQGGTDELANLRPAHARCNRSRGAGPLRVPTSWTI